MGPDDRVFREVRQQTHAQTSDADAVHDVGERDADVSRQLDLRGGQPATRATIVNSRARDEALEMNATNRWGRFN